MAKQSQRGAVLTAVPVLLTRPLAQSVRFGAALTKRFSGLVRPVMTPLMQPVFHSPPIPARAYAAVILTSAAAVEAALRLRAAGLGLPAQALCVGAQTAAAAREAGFLAQSANGDADALLAVVEAQGQPGPYLYLHGRDTRGDLANRLNAAGIETVAAIVYQQDALALSPEALDILQKPGQVIVPLFSPRSADLFARALPDGVAARLAVAAISDAVANAAGPLRPDQMLVADQPDAAAMLEVVNRLLMMEGGS